jgi:hypothetical protein
LTFRLATTSGAVAPPFSKTHAWVVGLAAALAACSPPGPPEPTAALVTTFSVPGRSPQIKRTPMLDLAACEEARAALIGAAESDGPVDPAAAARMQEAALERARKIGATVLEPTADGTTSAGVPMPKINALCIDLRR